MTMKIYYMILISFFLCISCNSDNEKLEHGQITAETYKLITVKTNSLDIPRLEGDELPFDELIILFEDYTFTKRRTTDGITEEIGGTYKWITNSDGRRLQLNYTKESALLVKCWPALNELLRPLDGDRLENPSFACDNVGLIYKLQ